MSHFMWQEQSAEAAWQRGGLSGNPSFLSDKRHQASLFHVSRPHIARRRRHLAEGESNYVRVS